MDNFSYEDLISVNFQINNFMLNIDKSELDSDEINIINSMILLRNKFNFNNKPIEFSNNLLKLTIEHIKFNMKTNNINLFEAEMNIKSLALWELGYTQNNINTLMAEQLPMLMIRHNFNFKLHKEVKFRNNLTIT